MTGNAIKEQFMTRTDFIKESGTLIKAAVRLNRIAIRHGIQELECEVEDLDDEDLRQGLYLLIDGAKPSKIDEIFSNKITFEKNNYARQYKTLLKRVLLAIREREKTESLIEILTSYVGLTKNEEQKFQEPLFNIFVNFPLEEDEGSCADNLIIDCPDEDLSLVEERKGRLLAFNDLTRLDDRAIQKVFREIDNMELAKALKGTGKQARARIFVNLSKRAAAELSEEMDYMGAIHLSEAEEAQQKIIAVIKRLADTEH
jgi:hypothetical protein